VKILRHSVFRGLSGTPGGRPVRSLVCSFKDIKDIARFLRNGVLAYRHNPIVRRAAMDAVMANSAPEKNKLSQAVAIATWVKQNCYYVHEPDEVFQTPENTLRERSGDCDDFTWLQCAMMESIGIPSKMNLVRIGGFWKHIYPSMMVKSAAGGVRNIPLDATLTAWPEEFPSPEQIAREQGEGEVYVMTYPPSF
jgi:transglutaminase-like putative cysteine protease